MVTLCAPEGKKKYGGGGKDMEEVCYPIWKIIIPGRTRCNFLINITGMEALFSFWKSGPHGSYGPQIWEKAKADRCRRGASSSSFPLPIAWESLNKHTCIKVLCKWRAPWLPLPMCGSKGPYLPWMSGMFPKEEAQCWNLCVGSCVSWANYFSLPSDLRKKGKGPPLTGGTIWVG